jgi:4-carboxymuconolactone decarboxylase
MTRIPHIDDSIIDQYPGLQGNENLLRLVFRSPRIGEAFAHLDAALLTGFALSPKLRELLILHTAWHMQSEYAWVQHLKIARSIGVTDAQIASIQQSQLESFAFSEKEKELLHFLSCIAASETLSSQDFEAVRRHFNDRELVEIIAVRGLYYTIAMLALVLDLEVDRLSSQ